MTKEASLTDPLVSYGVGFLWAHNKPSRKISLTATSNFRNKVRKGIGTFFVDKARCPRRFHGFPCHYVILQRDANDVDPWKGFLDTSGCLDTT